MNARKAYLLLFLSILIFLTPAVFAEGSPETEMSKGPVTVASKIDTEGALLGNMIVLLLEADGFEAVDRTEFGPTDIVRKAIKNGEIDIYPEYTGNGAFFYPDSPRDVWNDAKMGYETVKKWEYDAEKIVWLTPAPANNTWAIAVRDDLASSAGLVTLSDLADYVNGGGTFKLAGSEEFFSSAAAMPAFESAYGFSLNESQRLSLAGGNTTATEQAAARQTDGVNAAMAYGTDGQLAALGLTVLTDDKGVQPVYEPAPIIREEVLKEWPEIEGLLDPVFRQLDLVTLQTLNSRIAVDGENPRSVAEDWLKDNGFLD